MNVFLATMMFGCLLGILHFVRYLYKGIFVTKKAAENPKWYGFVFVATYIIAHVWIKIVAELILPK